MDTRAGAGYAASWTTEGTSGEKTVTEEEWLNSTDPTAMLRFLRHRASDRHYRLFAVACARDELARAQAGQGLFNFGNELGAGVAEFFWHPDCGYKAAVRAAESAADGGPKPHFPIWYVGWAGEAENIAYAALGHYPDGLITIREDWIAATVRRYTNHPAGYLRDIFGNPIRPVTISPALLTWNDAVVVRLAQAAYEERLLPAGTLDSGRLAVLGDALEEAGCTDADILGHLRGPGPHVRGCWPVDLCLGKT
jgi:hypothetical protein